MSSFGVLLPLSRDSTDGFTSLKSIKTTINQNLKMLILTAPGERIMEPEFGVGIRNYLFENFNNSIYKQIDTNIRKQVEMFMPAIAINEVSFEGSDQDSNLLGVAIFFSIPSIGVKDLLEFTI